MLRYLGRYTHRVAISNHRLLAFDGERVTFRWKDYAHGNKQRKMTLAATEFLRRFVQHVLPRGFVRIRQFGFLANSCRTARLSLARQLLAVTPKAGEPCAESGFRTSDMAVPAVWRSDAHWPESQRFAIGFAVQFLRQLLAACGERVGLVNNSSGL